MAAPAPLPASLPAPLPGTNNVEQNNILLPPPSIKLSLSRDEVFIGSGRLPSHGKLWIRSQCLKKGLIRTQNYQLPNPNIVFCFEPAHYAHSHDVYDAIKHKSPCIGHVCNQYILCDKALMVETLYNYYGEYAFKEVIPLSFVTEYDYINHEFKLHENKELIHCIQNTNIKKDESWIIKGSIGKHGTNVFLWSGNDINELQTFLLLNIDPFKWLDFQQRKYHNIRVVIDEYINNPLLYKDRFKFDTRIYLLIAKTNPVIAYYAGMKCRLSTQQYNIKIINDDEKNRLSHITNTYQQVLEMDDMEQKEDIALDWTQFLQFMYDVAVKQKKFDITWFNGNDDDDEKKNNDETLDCYDMEFEEFVILFENKMKRLCGLTVDAGCTEFDRMAIELDRVGQFAFLGVDILIDENGKMWLIELNAVPTILGGGNQTMQSTLNNLMFEMVDIVWEIREKRIKGINLTKYHEIRTKLKYWQPIDLKHYQKNDCQLFPVHKLKLRETIKT